MTAQALLAFLCVLAADAQEAANRVPTFRSEVSVVKVDLQVLPGPDKPAGLLTREDLVVYDEGKLQTINYFGRETEPLQLMLLLDVSESMRPSLRDVARTAREALSVLGPEDRVGLALFASRSQVVQPLTTDRSAFGKAIVDNMFKGVFGRETYLNEGLLTAADVLAATPVTSRRAILVISDNVSALSNASTESVKRALHDQNIVVNAVALAPAGEPLGVVDLRPYIEATGGEYMNSSAVAEPFKQLVERIKARYVLQYAMPPAESGKFRRLRVELSDRGKRRFPGATILAREGYFAP